jgi:hypothetical protein
MAQAATSANASPAGDFVVMNHFIHDKSLCTRETLGIG